jgi:hypothetical protein
MLLIPIQKSAGEIEKKKKKKLYFERCQIDFSERNISTIYS